MDIFTTIPAVVITPLHYHLHVRSFECLGGTCALSIALIVKELRSASKTKEQEPTLMAIINRIK